MISAISHACGAGIKPYFLLEKEEMFPVTSYTGSKRHVVFIDVYGCRWVPMGVHRRLWIRANCLRMYFRKCSKILELNFGLFLMDYHELSVKLPLLRCIWVISPIIDKRLYLTLFDLAITS